MFSLPRVLDDVDDGVIDVAAVVYQVTASTTNSLVLPSLCQHPASNSLYRDPLQAALMSAIPFSAPSSMFRPYFSMVIRYCTFVTGLRYHTCFFWIATLMYYCNSQPTQLVISLNLTSMNDKHFPGSFSIW